MKKLLTTAAILGMATFSQAALAEEYTVKMITDLDAGKYYFEPKELTIQSGDTVTWVNAAEDMHNAVSDNIPKGAEGFESPMLEKEGEGWSHTFKTSGTYSYHCHPHAAMNMRMSLIGTTRPISATVGRSSSLAAVADLNRSTSTPFGMMESFSFGAPSASWNS